MHFRRRLAVAAATLGLAAVPASASASATGYAYWNAFPASIGGQTIPIPGGQLTHTINGSGLHINWDGANFLSAGNLCDSSIKFTYGYGSYFVKSNISSGCTHAHTWKYALNWNAPRGTACAELWVYGWRKMITKQCHFVS